MPSFRVGLLNTSILPLAFVIQICYHNLCIKIYRKHDRCPINILFNWVKREAGVSPARTRRCKRGVLLPQLVKSCEGHWG